MIFCGTRSVQKGNVRFRQKRVGRKLLGRSQRSVVARPMLVAAFFASLFLILVTFAMLIGNASSRAQAAGPVRYGSQTPPQGQT